MRKFIFILGGARSGKSRYAVQLAKKLSQKVAYIATCTEPDAEMRKRIKLHRVSRPRQWKLFEEGKNIASVLAKLSSNYEVALLDCLGLFVSNLLAASLKDKQIETKIKQLIRAIGKSNFTTILVSNEVGAGIVPENPLARRFRDLVGLANQMFAKKADEVILMQAGIPLKIKGKSRVREGRMICKG